MKWAYGLVRNGGNKQNRDERLFKWRSVDSLLSRLLVAVSLHARGGGGFGVGGGDHGLGISLVEDTLNDLLLFGTEDLGQTFVKLGLFLLKAYTHVNG